MMESFFLSAFCSIRAHSTTAWRPSGSIGLAASTSLVRTVKRAVCLGPIHPHPPTHTNARPYNNPPHWFRILKFGFSFNNSKKLSMGRSSYVLGSRAAVICCTFSTVENSRTWIARK